VSEITGGGEPSREFHDASAGTGLWANKLENNVPGDTAPPKLGLRRTNGDNGVTPSQRLPVLRSCSNKLTIMKTLKLRTWTTIIKYISALGQTLTPLIILEWKTS
jgi:hypothetical protein